MNVADLSDEELAAYFVATAAVDAVTARQMVELDRGRTAGCLVDDGRPYRGTSIDAGSAG